ncbi:EAL domain-containing protein [Bermanella marisrubri]|uniref:Predicted signal transduction protein containing a membrane domain, an EAL and a GGDEF domain n=1 Tax=Bermanella marisrubri TaxID=207949 RepID=Q1N453_9GAMM|nr:EAL domain-containing protein [Bermanella marisrubri]EAT13012.1 predicted signal transduction protein containing a membrane domain, an EAL and a GGDEF domain [Oceanobacter sp. RED65] [Bermanella marisrubri]QIZ82861.1 EAL domain-containing protein [Bermanella marisrubri]
MWLSKLHLKTKLIGAILLTSVIAVMLTSYALVRYDRLQEIENVSEDMRILAAIVANRSTAALIFGDARQAEANLKALGENPNVSMACIYDASGSVFAYHHFVHLDQKPCPDEPQESELSIGTNLLEIYEPIELDGLNIGTLYMNLNLGWLAQRWQEQLVFIVMVTVLSLLLSLALAKYLQHLLVKPIQKIAATARDITRKQDYSLRAEREVKDELGEMVDVFNSMLSKIEQERSDLTSSEEKFRQLASLSPVGIFQINLKHDITYVNNRWSDITGIRQPNATLEHWLSHIRQEDRRAAVRAWRNLIENHQEFVVEVGFERNRDQITWAIIEASVLYDGQGEIYGYMGAISDITDLKVAQLQMENLAFFDPLTGLSNRRLFKDRLHKSISESKRRGSFVALLFLDLDQFKRINDSLGHDAGDVLLEETARRLENSVRESDTVSRIGGDEFTVLLNDVENTHGVRHIAEKILKKVCRPIMVKNQEIINTVSIGITLAPTDGDDVNTLMRNADMAMYQAKAMGRNNYQFFSEEMNKEMMGYLEIEKDLRHSIDYPEDFIIYYQPKIELHSGRFVGAEALIRWKPEGKDMIPPDRFIPIAEESGLIVPIGAHVIRQACLQVKYMINTGIWPEDGKVAINLSARQFSDPDLICKLQEILEQTKCPVHVLEFEITESTLMDNVENAIFTMRQIKEMGISIAIDDFGTGYSSLAYLKRFPIDVLKVDRSFVMDIPNDLNDMEITAAVIAMAHKLHLQVVAEGIETQEQIDFLKSNYCEYGQGFMIARPMPSDELERFIQRPLQANLM